MTSAHKRAKRKIYHLSAYGDFQVSYDVERLLRMLGQMPELELFAGMKGTGLKQIAESDFGNLAQELFEERSLDVKVELKQRS
jgi:hypothetical protein